MVLWLFLAVPWVCLRFVIMVFPNHTHLLFFRNTFRASNSLDPDQDRHSVGPDLGPNCLQRLSDEQTTKVATSKDRVK